EELHWHVMLHWESTVLHMRQELQQQALRQREAEQQALLKRQAEQGALQRQQGEKKKIQHGEVSGDAISSVATTPSCWS
ncbi:hypothetical protein DFQ26_005916, partial [Actinomortierella ambigua]